ncbi:Nudix family hydrolase [Nitrosococcus oceani]|uniref:Nudix family hydrolase n=1 Tax=Nitrosococcus oceani TaxID=1229 RepID=UPI0004E8D5A3|nr:Nudix family hydrolase [Nitrosococcus oceani]KFI23859.1 thiamine monophosphate synthase [Nitrosococcus oceani]
MVLQVAAGAIFNRQGQVLLSKRPLYVHQGNLWEFPGGKLKPGEEVRQALSRELWEELGIQVLQARPLLQVHHDYPDRSVLLHVWRVDRFSGTPKGQEGQPVVWVSPENLNAYPLPAANHAVVTAVCLPPTYLITKEPAGNQMAFLSSLRQSLQAGVQLVQLRAKKLSPEHYQNLTWKVQRLCFEYKAILLVNTVPAQAAEWGADGVHLTGNHLMHLSHRPLPANKWVAASCHNAAQLAHAANIGVDFAVLGPVFHTSTHPQALPLGWERFQTLIAQIPFPVYALGGVGPEHLKEAWSRGAQGIAAIRALWGDRAGSFGVSP